MWLARFWVIGIRADDGTGKHAIPGTLAICTNTARSFYDQRTILLRQVSLKSGAIGILLAVLLVIADTILGLLRFMVICQKIKLVR